MHFQTQYHFNTLYLTDLLYCQVANTGGGLQVGKYNEERGMQSNWCFITLRRMRIEFLDNDGVNHFLEKDEIRDDEIHSRDRLRVQECTSKKEFRIHLS